MNVYYTPFTVTPELDYKFRTDPVRRQSAVVLTRAHSPQPIPGTRQFCGNSFIWKHNTKTYLSDNKRHDATAQSLGHAEYDGS